MTPTAQVLMAVRSERDRQDAKWGVQNHPDLPVRWKGMLPGHVARLLLVPTAEEGRLLCEFESDVMKQPTYSHILVEEVAEAIHEAAVGDQDKLEQELIQVAAVATAWVECIRRRRAATEEAPF